MSLAAKLVAYYTAKGYALDRTPGDVNICYLEGANADGQAIRDTFDQWNDRRICFVFDEAGAPEIVLNVAATTEPGKEATHTTQAARLGGVARVQFGQFEVWQRGFHKAPQHPALVQRKELFVYRDANSDGVRTGDPLRRATGINQHGTRKGTIPQRVGRWSEGCLVGHLWDEHLQFIQLCEQHSGYKADPKYFFKTAIIPGNEFAAFNPNLTL